MGAFVYGALGFGLAIYVNSVRRLPLMRRPWEHFMMMGAGCVLGNYVDVARDVMKARLEDARACSEREKAVRDAKFAAYEAEKAKGQSAEDD